MATGLVRVTMVATSVLEHEDANKVDQESEHRYQKQSFMFHFRRFNRPLDRLRKYEERDEQ